MRAEFELNIIRTRSKGMRRVVPAYLVIMAKARLREERISIMKRQDDIYVTRKMKANNEKAMNGGSDHAILWILTMFLHEMNRIMPNRAAILLLSVVRYMATPTRTAFAANKKACSHRAALSVSPSIKLAMATIEG